MSKLSRRSTRSLALPSMFMAAVLFTSACAPDASGPLDPDEVAEPGSTGDQTPGEVIPAQGSEAMVGELALSTTLSSSTLQASTYANRTNSVTLYGATLKGNVVIHLPLSPTGVSKVEFFMDDTYRQRAPMRVDSVAPYDLMGSSSTTGNAYVFPTTNLADGAHALSVLVTYTSGKVLLASAPFTVANGTTTAPAPTPTPTPTPTPEPAPVPPAPTGLRSVAQWEQMFLSRWSYDHNIALPQSTSLDSWQFYNLGYSIDANTAMYRATGKTQYLDRALLYVNNVVNNARASSTLGSLAWRDSYLGWTSTRVEVAGQEVPLYESYCWRYVTRLLRVIKETPALYGNATYRAQYDRLLAFSEKNIFEKWYTRGANSYVYRNRTHMAAHWGLIALNLSMMTTDATKKATYLTVVNNINRGMPNVSGSMRGNMVPHPRDATAYFWSDVFGSRALPGQDVSHGNAVMAFITEAHEAGVEWTDADMRAFRNTFAKYIWPAAGRYAEYVDGSGVGNGWFNDGFVRLGRYDAALQRRLETHDVGQNGQFYGNAALNVRLLSEGSSI